MRRRRRRILPPVPIPARGHLKRVDGVEEAAEVPGVERVVITAKPDQLLEPLPEQVWGGKELRFHNH